MSPAELQERTKMVVKITNNAEKPFYGYVDVIISNLIIAIIFISGILIFLLFSVLIGIIIICLALYGFSSNITSLYYINPAKSIDYSDLIKLKGNELVLDVGCGLGRASVGAAKLLKTGKIIGIDVWDKLEILGNSPERAYKNAEIEGVRNKVEFHTGDALDLPFNDEYFDVVICAGCITTFKNDEQKIKAMKEIFRVLKTNGTFLMREPILSLKIVIILTPVILLIHMPTKNHWIVLLEKSGFKHIKLYKHRIAGSYKSIKIKK